MIFLWPKRTALSTTKPPSSIASRANACSIVSPGSILPAIISRPRSVFAYIESNHDDSHCNVLQIWIGEARSNENCQAAAAAELLHLTSDASEQLFLKVAREVCKEKGRQWEELHDRKENKGLKKPKFRGAIWTRSISYKAGERYGKDWLLTFVTVSAPRRSRVSVVRLPGYASRGRRARRTDRPGCTPPWRITRKPAMTYNEKVKLRRNPH